TTAPQLSPPPRRRWRCEPAHDPGKPVVGGLNGVRHRVQGPAQDSLEVTAGLCPPRRVGPIFASVRPHGSTSTTTRRAALAPARCRFTAASLTPMAEAIWASGRSP